LELILVLAVGLVAGTISGIVGTGASLILMPVLVVAFGPQRAVPIMAIAAVLGNIGKVLAWWRLVEKGAFIATEAAASCIVYFTKVIAFGLADALPADTILKGLAVGSSMMAGAFVSRRILHRMTPHQFRHLIDALMIVSGLSMFWVALR
jgi:uncharacterized membrane protein YfcA